MLYATAYSNIKLENFISNKMHMAMLYVAIQTETKFNILNWELCTSVWFLRDNAIIYGQKRHQCR